MIQFCNLRNGALKKLTFKVENFQMEVFETGITVCSKQRQLLANVWVSYSAKCMYLCNSICDRQKISPSLLFKTRAQKKVQFECHVVSRWKLAVTDYKLIHSATTYVHIGVESLLNYLVVYNLWIIRKYFQTRGILL